MSFFFQHQNSFLTISESHVWIFATPWTTQSMEFSRPEYWSGYSPLLQGIVPTQGSNPGLLHCRQILYPLSHLDSLLSYVRPSYYAWASLVAQWIKNLLAMQEAWVWSLGLLGRSLGEGKGYPLQYSGLENSMDCVVHGVTKSQTWLSNFHYHKWQTFIFLWVSSFPLYVSIHPLMDS